MGAGGTKNLQSEKAKNAAMIMSAFEEYGDDSKQEDDNEYEESPSPFRERLAHTAQKAKRHGVDIDPIVAAMSGDDFEQLENWLSQSKEGTRNSDFRAELIRERKEEKDDDNNDDTSVLSYGHDDDVDELDDALETAIDTDDSDQMSGFSPSRAAVVAPGCSDSDDDEDIRAPRNQTNGPRGHRRGNNNRGTKEPDEMKLESVLESDDEDHNQARLFTPSQAAQSMSKYASPGGLTLRSVNTNDSMSLSRTLELNTSTMSSVGNSSSVMHAQLRQNTSQQSLDMDRIVDNDKPIRPQPVGKSHTYGELNNSSSNVHAMIYPQDSSSGKSSQKPHPSSNSNNKRRPEAVVSPIQTQEKDEMRGYDYEYGASAMSSMFKAPPKGASVSGRGSKASGNRSGSKHDQSDGEQKDRSSGSYTNHPILGHSSRDSRVGHSNSNSNQHEQDNHNGGGKVVAPTAMLSPTKSSATFINMHKSQVTPPSAHKQHSLYLSHGSAGNINNPGSGGKSKNNYTSMAEDVCMRNEALMGLQRQKMWSYAENAQLEQDVLMLQRQLDQMESLEKSFSSSMNSAGASGKKKKKNAFIDTSGSTPSGQGTQLLSPLDKTKEVMALAGEPLDGSDIGPRGPGLFGGEDEDITNVRTRPNSRPTSSGVVLTTLAHQPTTAVSAGGAVGGKAVVSLQPLVPPMGGIVIHPVDNPVSLQHTPATLILPTNNSTASAGPTNHVTEVINDTGAPASRDMVVASAQGVFGLTRPSNKHMIRKHPIKRRADKNRLEASGDQKEFHHTNKQQEHVTDASDKTSKEELPVMSEALAAPPLPTTPAHTPPTAAAAPPATPPRVDANKIAVSVVSSPNLTKISSNKQLLQSLINRTNSSSPEAQGKHVSEGNHLTEGKHISEAVATPAASPKAIGTPRKSATPQSPAAAVAAEVGGDGVLTGEVSNVVVAADGGSGDVAGSDGFPVMYDISSDEDEEGLQVEVGGYSIDADHVLEVTDTNGNSSQQHPNSDPNPNHADHQTQSNSTQAEGETRSFKSPAPKPKIALSRHSVLGSHTKPSISKRPVDNNNSTPMAEGHGSGAKDDDMSMNTPLDQPRDQPAAPANGTTNDTASDRNMDCVPSSPSVSSTVKTSPISAVSASVFPSPTASQPLNTIPITGYSIVSPGAEEIAPEAGGLGGGDGSEEKESVSLSVIRKSPGNNHTSGDVEKENNRENEKGAARTGNRENRHEATPNTDTDSTTKVQQSPKVVEVRERNLKMLKEMNRRKRRTMESKDPTDIPTVAVADGDPLYSNIQALVGASGNGGGAGNALEGPGSEPAAGGRAGRVRRHSTQLSGNNSIGVNKDRGAESKQDTGAASEDEFSFGVQGKSVPSGNSNQGKEHAKDTKAVHRRGLRGTAQRRQGQAEPKKTVIHEEKPSLLSQTMDMRWCEVELMLRKPVKCQADVDQTLSIAEEGLVFINKLSELAKSLNILRGALSRWLLPYDNNTRLEGGQCSTPHSVISSMPDSLVGRVSDRQVQYFVSGANSVRQLVRIKIADDNDLEQARTALVLAVDFFHSVRDRAKVANISSFELLTSTG